MSQERTVRGNGELFGADTVDGFIHRAWLRGAGRSASEVRRRPVVGICSSWSELNPCNAGLAALASAVKRGVLANGGLPVIFPTISISEPYARPSSLLLRNLMAMDVEQMIISSPIDSVVLLAGCDKTVPAQIMGALSADKPALMLTAGPRPVSRWCGQPLTVDDLWPLADRRRVGDLSADEWAALEGCLVPGVGTCNVMGTAITMAAVAEVIGIALPGSALQSSTGAQRQALAEQVGARAVQIASSGPGPSSLVTRPAIENAVRLVSAVSGSTNALIHLAAIAGRVGVDLTVAQVNRWCGTTPVIADVRPSGSYLLEDLDADGGVPALMRELGDLIDDECITATGRTWREEMPVVTPTPSGALRSRSAPVDPRGAIAMLSGTLAPDGAVIKRSAASEHLISHVGRAVVFDGVQDLQDRIDDPDLDVDADCVLVLRGEGPRGGPGMPEVGHLPIPSKLLKLGVTDMVRVSDARMSGTATGTVVLHVAPEAAVGGPLALVRDGDLIRLDVDGRSLDLLVEQVELQRRAETWSAPMAPARGYDLLHWRHVSQATSGCDLDFLQPTQQAPHDAKTNGDHAERSASTP